MTKAEKNEVVELFLEALKSDVTKDLIKEGTIDALKSEAGTNAIVSALSSSSGQDTIANALGSKSGQNAIKKASLKAFKSEEGKEIFGDYFRDAFHEVVVPILEDHDNRLKDLENKSLMV